MLFILGYYCLLYWLCLHTFQVILAIKDFLWIIAGSIFAFGLAVYVINFFNYNIILMLLFALEILVVALYLLFQKRLISNFFFLILSFLLILFAGQTSEVLIYEFFRIPYALQESHMKFILADLIFMTIITLLLARGINYLLQHFKIYSLLHTSIINSLIISTAILLDVLIISSLDRLGRNSRDIKNILTKIQEKGATVDILDLPSFKGVSDPNLRNLLTNLVVELMSYVAQSEREKLGSVSVKELK